ncbi:hypothetical protein Acr_29g0000230 [Actinidia rufa]|uniref:Uncharacterized protein n=1 Tax=Actinidia rufa TaxID=165716 RepID=A0A7J0HD04_9ERIC|nr:hypothetical protein Acr_29g0000230 [Actinidia rufa]
MTEAKETSRILDSAADYDSAEVGMRNWMAEEETTKYLEPTVALWPLVDRARERWSRRRRRRRASDTGGGEEDAGSGDVAGSDELDGGSAVVLVVGAGGGSLSF